jgi:hypothetical protein
VEVELLGAELESVACTVSVVVVVYTRASTLILMRPVS